jgi:MoaA/NifB/PqqE/SkfB family radical SAM enzyme
MATGKANKLIFGEWEAGFKSLRELGCEFAAFYGAEPLYDFHNLPDVIELAEDLGIRTTLITSGLVDDVEEKIRELYRSGLRSLTMSYDINPHDRSAQLKMDRVNSLLNYFNRLGPNRDRAIVITLHRENFLEVPRIIREMSERNIWTFFDLIHYSRGQAGSKCAKRDVIPDLIFRKDDIPDLIRILSEIEGLKKSGHLCHSSTHFLNLLRADQGELVLKYNWNCAGDDNLFPSWVTVDCDGRVYPCDDFQPPYRDILEAFLVMNIAERFDEFKEYWSRQVLLKCPGCAWNTHIDAHQIKAGLLPLGDYVHTEEGKE